MDGRVCIAGEDVALPVGIVDKEISRGALDRTGRRVFVHFKQLLIHRRWGVVVSIEDCLVACGEGNVFPDC
jgi:hypothetical protein